MELTDKESHYIQNEIDLVMDMLKDTNAKNHILVKLEEIRDSIPCCCDSEDRWIAGTAICMELIKKFKSMKTIYIKQKCIDYNNENFRGKQNTYHLQGGQRCCIDSPKHFLL